MSSLLHLRLKQHLERSNQKLSRPALLAFHWVWSLLSGCRSAMIFYKSNLRRNLGVNIGRQLLQVPQLTYQRTCFGR